MVVSCKRWKAWIESSLRLPAGSISTRRTTPANLPSRLPVQPRLHPVEAARIVNDNTLPHLEVVSIGKEDYLEALNAMASGAWTGAKIYDALLLRCEMRGGAHVYVQSRRLQAVGAARFARENMRSLRATQLRWDIRSPVCGKDPAGPSARRVCRLIARTGSVRRNVLRRGPSELRQRN